MELWEPLKTKAKLEETSVLNGLVAMINKLTAQVEGCGGQQGSNVCWTCNEEGHARSECPNRHLPL